MYSWKPGARCRTNPQIVGAVCEQMAMENRLTAKNLVDDSRPENAPLHGEFTWEDSVAAEKWRESEARHIIGGLEIHIQEAEPVQAFVKISLQEPEYHPIAIEVKKKESREIMLSNLVSELKAIKRRYSNFTELFKLFEDIDNLVEELGAV